MARSVTPGAPGVVVVAAGGAPRLSGVMARHGTVTRFGGPGTRASGRRR